MYDIYKTSTNERIATNVSAEKACEITKMDKAEIEWAIEECGRCDDEEHTIVAHDENQEAAAQAHDRTETVQTVFLVLETANDGCGNGDTVTPFRWVYRTLEAAKAAVIETAKEYEYYPTVTWLDDKRATACFVDEDGTEYEDDTIVWEITEHAIA